MTRPLLTRILLAVTIILLPNISYAQRKSAGGVRVKLACVKVHQGISKLAYLSAKTKSYETVQLNVHHLSDFIHIVPDDSGRIQFYDPAGLSDEDQQPAPIASLKVSSKNSELLMLLFPASQKSRYVYHAKAIAGGVDFRYGSSCVINLTQNDIFFRKNKGKFSKVNKGGCHIVGGLKEGEQMNVEFGASHSVSRRMIRFYSATWTLNSNIRELCLIYQKSGKKWPSTKVISDSKPIAMAN